MPDKTPDAAFSIRAAGAPLDAPARTIHFFKQRQYICWDIETETLIEGYPRAIRDDWPGLLDAFPGARLKAALYVPEWGDTVYFMFAGQAQAVPWNLAARQREAELVDIVALLPGSFAAAGDFAPVYAQVASGERVVYGFRGEDYTRWTVRHGERPRGEDAGFPRRIAPDWKDGLMIAPKCGVHAHWPSRSTAHSNNKIYFFMGDLYQRWDVPSNSRNYRTDIYAGWKNWPEFD